MHKRTSSIIEVTAKPERAQGLGWSQHRLLKLGWPKKLKMKREGEDTQGKMKGFMMPLTEKVVGCFF
jgi:hypothetical protein